MNSDYYDLKNLQNSLGFQKLQALWAHEGARVMESTLKSAAKGQESAWRYYAGQMKGFDLAITHLNRALLQMEKEGEAELENSGQQSTEDLLRELRGEPKP